MTCFWRGFIAQSVEYRTSIAKVMGSNPVEASEFFLGFICNCLSYFTTAKISFASVIAIVVILIVVVIVVVVVVLVVLVDVDDVAVSVRCYCCCCCCCCFCFSCSCVHLEFSVTFIRSSILAFGGNEFYHKTAEKSRFPSFKYLHLYPRHVVVVAAVVAAAVDEMTLHLHQGSNE